MNSISTYFDGITSISDYCRVVSKQIEDLPQNNVEVQNAKAKLEELDPKDKFSATLSEHRKRKLVEDIDRVFYALKPTCSPLEKKQREFQALEQIQEPKCFHQRLKKIDPEIKDKIYRLVWIASGCPQEYHFSELLLKKDLSILQQKYDSLIGGKPGTLWNQIKEELFDRDIEQRTKFFQRRLQQIDLTHIQINALFEALPLSVQQRYKIEGKEQPPFYGRGFNPKLHQTLGAQFKQGETSFAVYAPHAKKITLNLSLNHKTQTLDMAQTEEGIWKTKTHQAPPGCLYHFMVTGQKEGEPQKKLDPFAFQNVVRSATSGIDHESQVACIKKYSWEDKTWPAKRAKRCFSKEPLSIYEIHPSSWMLNKNKQPLNWRQLAPPLANYCKQQGYNAVELNVMSMGDQITHFFAPNPEMGNWEDVQYFVNWMHIEEILVFVDWFPVHFAKHPYSLSCFDGTAIFEDNDPTYATHPSGETHVFDYKKQFTWNFLASNADFILDRLDVDGLKWNDISSMLHLNDSRPQQQHRRNRNNTEINLEAVALIRNLNTYLHQKYPGVLMMAGESADFPNITCSPFTKGEHISQFENKRTRGLGFDFTIPLPPSKAIVLQEKSK